MAEPASGVSSVPGGVKYRTKGFPSLGMESTDNERMNGMYSIREHT